jgi:hypothetical protein
MAVFQPLGRRLKPEAPAKEMAKLFLNSSLPRKHSLQFLTIDAESCFNLRGISLFDPRSDSFVLGVHFRFVIPDVIQRGLDLTRR